MLATLVISSDLYVDVLSANIYKLYSNNNLDFKNMFFLINSLAGKEELKQNLEELKIPFDDLNVFVPNTMDWGKSLKLLVSDLISQNYTNCLLILDDFFIDDFKNVYKFFPKFDEYYVLYLDSFPLISKIRKVYKKFLIAELYPNKKYGINLQPAIWNLEVLANYCEKFSLPWEFEQPINKTNIPLEKIGVVIPSQLKYHGQVIEKGKWYPFKKLINRKYILKKSNRKNIFFTDYIFKVLKDNIKRIFIRINFCIVYFKFIIKC